MSERTSSMPKGLRGVQAGIRDILSTPLYRNAYALALSTLSTSGLGIVYWFLAARLYPAATVGLSSAAISAMMFISSLASLNLSDALSRFIPNTGERTRNFILYSYITTGILSAVFATIFAAVYLQLTGSNGFLLGSVAFSAVFVVAVMMWTIFNLQDAALTGLRQATVVPIENTIFSIVKIVLLVVMLFAIPTYGIFVSWTIPVGLSLIPINYLIFRRFVPRHIQAAKRSARPITFQSLRKFILGNYIGSLFHQSFITLPPLIVVTLLGPEVNAIFYIPWLIGNSFDLLPKDMAQSLSVEGAFDEDALSDLASNLLTHMLAILVPLAVFTALFAPLILRIFGAQYAADGATLLRVLALSVVIRAVNFLYMGICRVRENISGILIVQITLSVGILGMGTLALEQHGVVGFGLAWFGTQTLVGLFALHQLRDIINHNTMRQEFTRLIQTYMANR